MEKKIKKLEWLDRVLVKDGQHFNTGVLAELADSDPIADTSVNSSVKSSSKNSDAGREDAAQTRKKQKTKAKNSKVK